MYNMIDMNVQLQYVLASCWQLNCSVAPQLNQ